MLIAEVLETQRRIDAGVIERTADANIGSIFGDRLPGVDRRGGAVRRAAPRWGCRLLGAEAGGAVWQPVRGAGESGGARGGVGGGVSR
jgi:hypothetical protein